MADPPTPPHTPASSSKGTPNVNQGNVNNGNIRNNGGVVTGNIAGFNTIVGTLNITVDSASKLTDNIQSFTARVETAADRLKNVETRIRATSQLLGSIRDLVIAQAAKEDIQINRDFRFEERDETARGIPSNNGTTGGNAAGEGERGGIDTGQAAAGDGPGPEPNILEKSCFRDLVNASESAADRFDRISTKIRGAFNKIKPMHRGQAKVELSEEDRQKFFLTEKDIDDMERNIESHKLEVQIALTVFEATMGEKRDDAIRLIVLEMVREIKRIGEYFFNRSHGPLFPPPPGRPRGTRGLNEQDDNRYAPGSFHRDPYFNPYNRQSAYPYIRPFVFPDLSRLTSLYLGWTFIKGRPPYLQINPQSSQPSWRWAICSQMALSTEELFLKVLAQTTKRSKLQRSIQDDCKDLLRTSVQRMLLDNLLQEQNMNLWRQYPFLELKLAGLSCKRKRIGFFTEETKSIDVILKTEWSPDAPRYGPMGPGPGGGPPPPSGGGGRGGAGPYTGGTGDGGPFSGPGRRLGTGLYGGAGGGSGPGYPPGRGPRHTSQVPPPTPPGGSGSRPDQTSHKTRPPPGVHHSPPRTTPSKSAPEIVSREPRMYLVRKKKGKAAASDSESPRRMFIRDKRCFLRVFTDNGRPTSSHTDNIDGVPVSAQPVHHYPRPPPPPTTGAYSYTQATHEQTEYIPGDIRPQTPVYPPPHLPPETVTSSSSLSSSSSSDESVEYSTMPPRPQPPRHYPRPSTQMLSQIMTHEQEKKVIDEIFAEWEDGVHSKPTTTEPASQNQNQEQKLAQEERKKLHTPSTSVPQIGPTRLLMMEVEHEAQRQESIEATMRESQILGESSHHRSRYGPSWSRRRRDERSRSRSVTRLPRRSRGVNIVIDGDEDAAPRRRHASKPEVYYRHSDGPNVVIPGPSRASRAPDPEFLARESPYAHVHEADVEVSVPPGREFFDTPVAEHFFDTRRAGEREREYFDTPVVERLHVARPEGHGRVRVVPSSMARGRQRISVVEGPEGQERERGRRNIEMRSPRVELYESLYEDSSE